MKTDIQSPHAAKWKLMWLSGNSCTVFWDKRRLTFNRHMQPKGSWCDYQETVAQCFETRYDEDWHSIAICSQREADVTIRKQLHSVLRQEMMKTDIPSPHAAKGKLMWLSGNSSTVFWDKRWWRLTFNRHMQPKGSWCDYQETVAQCFETRYDEDWHSIATCSQREAYVTIRKQ